MTPKSPSAVFKLTVALDYGQFYLLSWPVQNEHVDLIAQVAEAAINDEGSRPPSGTRSWP
jgi:hypothetical protein